MNDDSTAIALHLVRSQTREWLRRAVEDGTIEKKAGKYSVAEAELGL